MPELPEMENYRIQLSQHILDVPMTEITIHREKSINMEAAAFAGELTGRQIIFIERRGKHLLFHLDNGKRLLLHLMLGGLLYLGSQEDRPDRNTQIEIAFADGQALYFIGLRLGHLHLHSAKEAEELMAHLGPELLDRRMNEARFISILRKRRGSLKTTLVNQDVVAGIGNRYADEIAFAAGLLPMAKLQNMSEEDLSHLYKATREVLLEAIEAGGYIELPLFKNDTLTGGANGICRVYDREGEPCPRCGDSIVKAEMNGRKVFYSPGCQHDR
ncbi:DNA-formamidopyrimidine glycosylase family protein [Paenibacillus sp. FSL R5-0527]|uniref:Fpg/Nei family DNA glycosylase n=1 Tax=Paenibacillus TaxID=44249 RepID=UPI00097BA18A|nr:DNA-formamidopyrimidine glycosylase family protein [Paenibacillus macerans]MED4958288.1 DNA-formamidopyrimidine glycosylase family protein [Paenibacillus macerans]OMG51454.1 endonuclease VIII [Paenibacillus macerans]